MDAYVDLTYYTGTFKGSAIPAASFPGLALKATAIVNALTFDRAKATITAASDTETIDLIKQATCAVADEYYKASQEGGEGASISSEKIGNYSVTYAVDGDRPQSLATRALSAAWPYLINTGLLFRGIE